MRGRIRSAWTSDEWSPDARTSRSIYQETGELDAQQRSGMGDMDVADFRAAAHAAVEIMADYLSGVAERPVMPQIEPGSLRPLFPPEPPEEPEPIGTILEDYRRLFEPNVTHWQHPRFLAYFSSSASGPGIIGEMLTAVLNSNPMLWRTSPAGTELEEVIVDWLRQGLGLPPGFDGLLTDTASTSSLLALAAARQAAGLDAAAMGLSGREDVPQLRVYASAEAHSSIEKACMTLGLGRAGLSKVPTNDRFELRLDALEEAIALDRKRRDSADRHSRDGRHHFHHLGRPGRRPGTHRPARRDLAARGCGLRGRRGPDSGTTRSVRRLGRSRLRSSRIHTSGSSHPSTPLCC